MTACEWKKVGWHETIVTEIFSISRRRGSSGLAYCPYFSLSPPTERRLAEVMDTQEISRPRFIDTIESPQDATRMKVIVLGASR